MSIHGHLVTVSKVILRETHRRISLIAQDPTQRSETMKIGSKQSSRMTVVPVGAVAVWSGTASASNVNYWKLCALIHTTLILLHFIRSTYHHDQVKQKRRFENIPHHQEIMSLHCFMIVLPAKARSLKW